MTNVVSHKEQQLHTKMIFECIIIIKMYNLFIVYIVDRYNFIDYLYTMNVLVHSFVKNNMSVSLTHYEFSSCKPHLVILLYELHMPLSNDLSCNKLLFCSVTLKAMD